jgi:hypothetical protein
MNIIFLSSISDKIMAVFSAPGYAQFYAHNGGVIKVNEDLVCQFYIILLSKSKQRQSRSQNFSFKK